MACGAYVGDVNAQYVDFIGMSKVGWSESSIAFFMSGALNAENTLITSDAGLPCKKMWKKLIKRCTGSWWCHINSNLHLHLA